MCREFWLVMPRLDLPLVSPRGLSALSAPELLRPSLVQCIPGVWGCCLLQRVAVVQRWGCRKGHY